jgi:hypothetical protein
LWGYINVGCFKLGREGRYSTEEKGNNHKKNSRTMLS